MSDQSVIAHIHQLIDEKLSSNVAVTVAWITRCVMEERGDIQGEDADFYRECASRDLARIARSALGKYDTDDVTPTDLLLPGFVHLCKAYPITRNDVPMLVPVALCTDDELAARAGQLEDMAKGCKAHAREIREYIMARTERVAA